MDPKMQTVSLGLFFLFSVWLLSLVFALFSPDERKGRAQA